MTRRRLLATGAVASLPVVLAACGSGSGSGGSTSGGATTAERPRTGGRLRTGHLGAGKDESLDPGKGANAIDVARYWQLYNGLVREGQDGTAEMVLAESMEPNRDGSVWNIKLRRGVEFHNGKTFTADDVIYSLTRPYDTKAGLSGSALAPFFDPRKGFKKISDTELEMTLTTPVGSLPTNMFGRDCMIYPDRFTDFERPVGTGPFSFVSFSVGERSLFARNRNYWEQGGGPYVDELEMITIADGAARANALLGGEIDAAEMFDYDQARALKDDKRLQLLNAETTANYPIVMRTDTEPFKDPNVRLAFKLAVDRQRCIDIALSGFGSVGNDMFGKGLAGYPDLPQRAYDPEQAKSLLAAAGYGDGLDVTIRYPLDNPGQKAATVFAEQAKASGINVKVARFPPNTDFNVAPTFPSFVTNWSGSIMGVGVWMLSDSNYNEGWFNRGWDRLYREANATVDPARRVELMEEMNRTFYEEGAHMVWGNYNNVDGLAPNVRGAYPSPLGFGLSNYDLKAYWLA